MKPYNLQYYPREDFPRYNLQHSECTTQVKNLRSRVPPLSLETEGFEIHHVDSRMIYMDFKSDSQVESIYYRDLEEYFKQVYKAKNVRTLDYQVGISATSTPPAFD